MSRPLTWTANVAAALALTDGGIHDKGALHRFTFGDFIRIGRQLRPWSTLVRAAGIDPLALGPVFLLMGITQITAAGLFLLRHRWGTRSFSRWRSRCCGI